MEKKIKKFTHKYRNALIIAGVIGLLTAIGLFFFVPRDFQNTPVTKSPTASDLIMQALYDNGSVVCTVNTQDLQGVVYVKEGSVKLEEKPGGQYGNLLLSKNLVYMWKANEKTGMRVDIDKNPLAKSFINENEIRRQIEQGNPDCKPESIESGVFQVPTDVVFNELDLNMQNLLNGGR